MAEPITLAEAKTHLRVVVADEDTLIQRLIVAARQMAEERTQRALAPRAETLALECWPAAIRLPWPPLADAEDITITYRDVDGAEQTLPPESYRVNAHIEPARITRAAGATWPTHAREDGAIVVEYEAGPAAPADVPAPLVQWMLLAIGTLYENRESVAAGVSIAALPDDFMALLWRPYVVYT